MKYRLFGIKLQVLRLMLRVSQPVMSRRLGIPLKTYQHLEEAQHEPLAAIVATIQKNGKFVFEPEDFTTWIDDATADLILGRTGKIVRKGAEAK